jgi:hypothetical protein
MQNKNKIIDATTIEGNSLISPDLQFSIDKRINWYIYNLGFLNMGLKCLDVENIVVFDTSKFDKRLVISLSPNTEMESKIITNLPENIPQPGKYFGNHEAFDAYITENEYKLISEDQIDKQYHTIDTVYEEYKKYVENFKIVNKAHGVELTLNAYQDVQIDYYVGFKFATENYIIPTHTNPALIFRGEVFKIWVNQFYKN